MEIEINENVSFFLSFSNVYMPCILIVYLLWLQHPWHTYIFAKSNGDSIFIAKSDPCNFFAQGARGVPEGDGGVRGQVSTNLARASV